MPEDGFDVNDYIVDYQVEISDDTNFLYTPEELQEKMGRAAYDFAYSNRKLRDLEVKRRTREQQTRIIILSKRFDLIQNLRLRLHLERCFLDPKFKPTKEDLESFIYMEHRVIFEEYASYEKIARQANREFEMWQSQLMWYQSKMKHERLDMMSAGM